MVASGTPAALAMVECDQKGYLAPSVRAVYKIAKDPYFTAGQDGFQVNTTTHAGQEQETARAR